MPETAADIVVIVQGPSKTPVECRVSTMTSIEQLIRHVLARLCIPGPHLAWELVYLGRVLTYEITVGSIAGTHKVEQLVFILRRVAPHDETASKSGPEAFDDELEFAFVDSLQRAASAEEAHSEILTDDDVEGAPAEHAEAMEGEEVTEASDEEKAADAESLNDDELADFDDAVADRSTVEAPIRAISSRPPHSSRPPQASRRQRTTMSRNLGRKNKPRQPAIANAETLSGRRNGKSSRAKPRFAITTA